MDLKTNSGRSVEQIQAAVVDSYSYESLDGCAVELSRLGLLITREIEDAFAASVSDSDQAAA